MASVNCDLTEWISSVHYQRIEISVVKIYMLFQ
jgi:hypothetical protein